MVYCITLKIIHPEGDKEIEVTKRKISALPQTHFLSIYHHLSTAFSLL